MTENCTSVEQMRDRPFAKAASRQHGSFMSMFIHALCFRIRAQSLAVPSDSVTRRRLATSFVCAILAWLMSSRVSGASLSMTAGPIGGLLWGGWVCCW